MNFFFPKPYMMESLFYYENEKKIKNKSSTPRADISNLSNEAQHRRWKKLFCTGNQQYPRAVFIFFFRFLLYEKKECI
jgi:hypothetical protein